ncbi:MAG: hypothetical protein AAGG50_07815 [Bacteroidota bacterium]
MNTIQHTLTQLLLDVSERTRRFRLAGLPTVFAMLPEQTYDAQTHDPVPEAAA